MADAKDISHMSDRREGRLLRSLPVETRMLPYVMTQRDDAVNTLAGSVEISGIEQWLREARGAGWSGIGFIHLLVAAYVRTVSMQPGINRFVAARRIFARNDIQVVFPVRRSTAADAAQTPVKVSFSPTDTVYDVFRRMNEAADEIKANVSASPMEKAALRFARVPRLPLRMFMGILRVMNYFDWTPRSMLDNSPFHASLRITDMGSLGVPPVSSPMARFGTLPMSLSFGARRKGSETDKNGTPRDMHYVDYTICYDRRIISPAYFAGALKCLTYFLKNPKLLELPPETVEDDVN